MTEKPWIENPFEISGRVRHSDARRPRRGRVESIDENDVDPEHGPMIRVRQPQGQWYLAHADELRHGWEDTAREQRPADPWRVRFVEDLGAPGRFGT
ncbi:hypothetical protein [Embleya sp. AB8]|uniref:hypothetical protein n=1 Tax=Embleya sp. AB8 TaxID=3156304 RepID=UPI003C73D436